VQHLVLGVGADVVVGEVAGHLGERPPHEPTGHVHPEGGEPAQPGHAIFARDWGLPYFEWEVPPDLVPFLEAEVLSHLPRDLRALIRLTSEGLFR
jgi:hypothetical protein